MSILEKQFVDHITGIAQKTVADFIQIGRLLTEAKKGLPHGMFLSMVREKLPFSEDTAQNLMAVADFPPFAKTEHVRLLPPHISTMREIVKLGEEGFEKAVAEGKITPKTERLAIKRLRDIMAQPPLTIREPQESQPSAEAVAEGSAPEKARRESLPDDRVVEGEVISPPAQSAPVESAASSEPTEVEDDDIDLPLDPREAEIILGILNEYAFGILQAPKTVDWEPHVVQEAMRSVAERLHVRMQRWRTWKRITS
ncbi:MAG: DUF3102 domain-containing protein [Magnetococcales bacterium]|nr:DUF3102 domain-containing protein [Magnetococcales bacterium]